MKSQETLLPRTPHGSWPETIAVGDALPELRIPITATLIVTGAIATRDFQKVHHDKDVAVAAGTKDVFMNILTTNALVNRYVGEWAPAAHVKRINIRLGATNFPGDEMVFSGSVESVLDGQIRVLATGTNSLGTHVTASIDLAFPTRKETA
ncbi:acyl dehydratase [Arthrobacter sp. BL-252-APC-1A]|uniref:MaoC/PaaZ C-terminal domain-containing protein n=1 Tax=Arthrobacter sp. BL-252-APC-1A TaxID=2606622 RepID=UPI0012B3E2A2|nr:MaoC/PaaZ C-terminal domain-containing protein [Arthrobacter sp. BL-252-APC-1A]MSR97801.1 acyl dehydratase [Arthrobacter sp. BL-252-APC-1A]